MAPPPTPPRSRTPPMPPPSRTPPATQAGLRFLRRESAPAMTPPPWAPIDIDILKPPSKPKTNMGFLVNITPGKSLP
ncbi:hypothetical protein E2562_037255 [Oryza meyeriana var. granulata]|uniref:Uncharacterized protein n=1 Tax=Oryza meyeriana var. granulata TaxID=110450 RepID=A0A6G1BNZ1_9ORYZ|nr:hypothetical protein E2562_037255 [Oryza meyeriana var. granulata]